MTDNLPTPDDAFTLTQIVFPSHVNHYGTLHGGYALQWMDQAAWICATRYSHKTMVTIASDRVEFKKPVHEGAIVLLKEMGFTVEERHLSIDDIMDAYKAGILYEVFGTGTAATISLIRELRYKDFVMEFDVDKWKTAPGLKNRLNAIRYGQEPDNHGWMYKI